MEEIQEKLALLQKGANIDKKAAKKLYKGHELMQVR